MDPLVVQANARVVHSNNSVGRDILDEHVTLFGSAQHIAVRNFFRECVQEDQAGVNSSIGSTRASLRGAATAPHGEVDKGRGVRVDGRSLAHASWYFFIVAKDAEILTKFERESVIILDQNVALDGALEQGILSPGRVPQ